MIKGNTKDKQINRVKGTEKEFVHGWMELYMMVNGQTINVMAMVK
jgi:hypothetical protein